MKPQIDLNAYQDSGFEQEHRSPSDRMFYGLILGGVFTFFALSYPYRIIHIPSVLLAVPALIVIMLMMASAYFRPHFYLASIIFCIYIPFSGKYVGDFGGKLPLGINFTNMLFVPLLMQWLIQRNQLRAPLVRYHAPDIPLFIFCFLSSIAVLRVGIEHGNAGFGMQVIRVKRWLLPFLIYFIFVNTKRNEKGVRYLIVTICMTLTAIAILIMKESFDIGPGGSWDRIRVHGVLGNSNNSGAFFVYYTPIFLGLFLHYFRYAWTSWLLLIPLLLCARAMTLTNSRGGMIAFILAILATTWFRSKLLFSVGVLAIILAYYNPQFLPETITGRLGSTIRDTQKPTLFTTYNDGYFDTENVPSSPVESSRLDASADGRRRIWIAGFKMFMDKPWFGYGYGEFPKHVGEFDSFAAFRDPHNTYLGIAVEMGVFALFFLLVTLLFLLRSFLRVYHHTSDLFMRSLGMAGIGMMMGFLCSNIFGSRMDTVELTAYFWVVSAIIVQYDRELAQKMRDEVGWQNILVPDPWKKNEEEELV